MSPQLLVTDLEKSIEFYTKMLGFETAFRYEDFYVAIEKNGCSIHLKSGTPSREERKNKRSNNDLDIVIVIDGVEELYEDFQKKPIEIIQPLCQRPYGKEFYIADPDGYIIAFLKDPS
jgi:catechol 2,3-dioxygenase-like lactoylglutathione lyase family enzyme